MNAPSSGKYELLDRIAEEFADRFRRGERPSLHEYTQRYPELADAIRELFPAVIAVERIEPAEKAPSGTPLRQVGDYCILREIGRGGMGVVYEAEQSSLGRRVALKVLPLHGGADSKALERFKREARAAAKLHHTNIVPVFDVGQDGPVCFYAMQFIQGQGLDQVIAEVRRLRSMSERRKQPTVGDPRTQDFPAEKLARSMLTGHFCAQDLTAAANPDEGANRPIRSAAIESMRASGAGANAATAGSTATLPGQTDLSAAEKDHPHYFESIARIGRQTASALAHAHERGIIHRDIKPSNLLLDASGIVWVTDFGLAKTEEADLTSPGDILGTFRYMAPERFKGHSDPRSDVYALGITLYELLVLRPAFQGCDRATLMSEIANDDPPRPRSLDRRIPRDLETIVTKAMAKDPARRYRTAEEMAEDLGRFLENRPILARRVSAPERAWRWCKRNRAVALLMSVVFLLLTGATIGSIAVAIQLSRQSTQLADVEVDRTEKVYQTYQARLAQAYANRSSQRVGQRFVTLDAVREAAELVRTQQMPGERLEELRNLAITALTLPDLRTLRSWKRIDGGRWDTDRKMQLLAMRSPDGSIAVTRLDTEEVIARCKGEDNVRLSPSGRFLLSFGGNRFHVWELVQTGPRLLAEGEENGCAFHPDGRHLLMGGRDGTLWLHDLAGPEQKPTALITVQPAASGLVFDPQGEQLAMVVEGRTKIVDAHTGRTLASIPDSSQGGTPAWHPSGKYLAVIADKGVPDGIGRAYGGRDIHLWDLDRMQRIAVLRGCPQGGMRVAFTPDGDRLLGRGLDGVICLWDWRTGRLLLQHAGHSNFTISPSGQLVVEDHDQMSLVALSSGKEYRSFVQRLHDDEQGVAYGEPIVHPEGRLLAVNTSHCNNKNQWVSLFDLDTGEELAVIPQAHWRMAFQADGTLLTNGDQGLIRWPIQQKDACHWQVGPPNLLFPHSYVDMAADRNGDVIGQANGRGALLVRPGKGTLFLGPHGAAQHIAISPNGDYAITGINDGEQGVKLWDIRTRRLLKTFPMGVHCYGRFSPDGRWLALGSATRGSYIVECGSWNKVFDGPVGPFSSDGSLVAIEGRQGFIRLVAPGTWRDLARLENPNRTSGGAEAFTPDGTKLVISSDADRAIHVWDLRAIREQLAEMGLDWDAPPYPPAKPTPRAPLRVTVDSGWVDAPRTLVIQSMRLGLNPWDVEAYLQRGQAYHRVEKAQDAVNDFSTALALMPADHMSRAEALLYRSRSYRKLSRIAESRADIQRIAEEDLPLPERLSIIGGQECNNLAWYYVAGPEHERDPHKALPIARKALKLTPEDRNVMNTLGTVYYRLGQFPQAVEWLERSLRDRGGDGAAFDLLFLAMCHARLGDRVKAKECFDQAVRWVTVNQSILNGAPEWRQELKMFQAEAESVLAPLP
jgi:eukaryotic-like serine/threonine-protein kinase